MNDPHIALAEIMRDNAQLQARVNELEARICALAAALAILLTCVQEGKRT